MSCKHNVVFYSRMFAKFLFCSFICNNSLRKTFLVMGLIKQICSIIYITKEIYVEMRTSILPRRDSYYHMLCILFCIIKYYLCFVENVFSCFYTDIKETHQNLASAWRVKFVHWMLQRYIFILFDKKKKERNLHQISSS